MPLDGLDGAPSPVPRALASALPDLVLGAGFAYAWIAPARVGPGMIRWMLMTMLLEFIVIHSSAFMGKMAFAPVRGWVGASCVIGLGCFYTLFVVGFCLSFHTWWPLLSFWALTLNRASVVLFGQAPSGSEQKVIMSSWAATTLFYLAGCALTAIPPLPHPGWTADWVANLHLGGSGVWISEPWRPVAFGTVYFTAVGLFELFAVPAIAGGRLPAPEPMP